jgi:hypothetical protein
MTTVKRRIACFCESTFEADIPATADLAADPEVEPAILAGEFMAVTCPTCGKRLTPEFPFRLSGVPEYGELLLVPEGDRVALSRGKLAEAAHVKGRIAVGFAEMAEKLLIARAGLDDRVIEIMKYYLMTSPGSGGEAVAGKEDAVVYYRGVAEGRHVFHIVGMRKDEVAVARLGPDVYARIASDVESRVREEPFSDFCVPPWVSLRRVGEDQP